MIEGPGGGGGCWAQLNLMAISMSKDATLKQQPQNKARTGWKTTFTTELHKSSQSPMKGSRAKQKQIRNNKNKS